jgi:hypothetical protein
MEEIRKKRLKQSQLLRLHWMHAPKLLRMKIVKLKK